MPVTSLATSTCPISTPVAVSAWRPPIKRESKKPHPAKPPLLANSLSTLCLEMSAFVYTLLWMQTLGRGKLEPESRILGFHVHHLTTCQNIFFLLKKCVTWQKTSLTVTGLFSWYFKTTISVFGWRTSHKLTRPDSVPHARIFPLGDHERQLTEDRLFIAIMGVTFVPPGWRRS